MACGQLSRGIAQGATPEELPALRAGTRTMQTTARCRRTLCLLSICPPAHDVKELCQERSEAEGFRFGL
jgi:hypothetical protein